MHLWHTYLQLLVLLFLFLHNFDESFDNTDIKVEFFRDTEKEGKPLILLI